MGTAETDRRTYGNRMVQFGECVRRVFPFLAFWCASACSFTVMHAGGDTEALVGYDAQGTQHWVGWILTTVRRPQSKQSFVHFGYLGGGVQASQLERRWSCPISHRS